MASGFPACYNDSLVGPDDEIGSVYVSLRDTSKMVDFIALQRQKA